MNFVKISLKNLLNKIGDNSTAAILSDFSCKINPDIEYFLKERAIEFENQGVSATHLVFKVCDQERLLAGYYTLAIKAFNITRTDMSSTLSKRIRKFTTYDSDNGSYILPAPLIAQLGKNFAQGCNSLITGDQLLDLAVTDVKTSQQIIGGKVVYLECEDNRKLLDFYSRNGFTVFGKRSLDKDESNISGKYLIQMLRYLK